MPLTTEIISDLIGVKESYQASSKLMAALQDDNRRTELFDQFLKHEQDLSYDWFLDYYQEEHSNRKDDKQDFTPDGVASLAISVLGRSQSSLDMCAGTGGLTIKMWADDPDRVYICEELSERAFPFLLFNLAIRNVDGLALRGDSLTRDFAECYQLTKGERFSTIAPAEPGAGLVDTAILNPPYSLKWEHAPGLLNDPRFQKFGALAPKSKADYAFVLTALSMLKPGGRLLAILPHGVLFRGSAEAKIRSALIEENLLDGLIGIPGGAFLNTSIPTVMMVLQKDRSVQDTIIIDASEQCEKEGKYNIIKPEHVVRVAETYKGHKAVERLSTAATLEEMRDNDYNLNLPRYVDIAVPEPVPELSEVLQDLLEIDEDIADTRKELAEMMRDLVARDPADQTYLGRIADHMMAQVGQVLPGERPPVIRRPRVIEEETARSPAPAPEESKPLTVERREQIGLDEIA